MAPSLRESDPEEDVRLYGFPPAAEADAQILILGSMPSEASLKAGAYYAHPRNRFWPVMGALLGFDPETLYEKRIEALKKNRIAHRKLRAHRKPRFGHSETGSQSDRRIPCRPFRHQARLPQRQSERKDVEDFRSASDRGGAERVDQGAQNAFNKSCQCTLAS